MPLDVRDAGAAVHLEDVRLGGLALLPDGLADHRRAALRAVVDAAVLVSESRPIFPRPLPETLEGGAQLNYFGSDWQPRVLVPDSSATGSTVAAGGKDAGSRVLGQALDGLNRRFGLARTPSFVRHPIFWMTVALVVFFVLLAVTLR